MAAAMDWSTTSPFGIIKEHLHWLDQRQQTLAHNIANADTPGYVPRDLEPLRFRDMMHRQAAPVRIATTDPGHLGDSARPAAEFVERERRDGADASPAGNAVDLEEEMAKVNETAVSHRLATQLYRKYLGLVRMAASARG
jgi:flagellar basal-body rod protein FlgB